ncbi:hypothetical protein [Georgenia faecalis]|uniref:MmyB family transcriptional regulator n=1 Tax=Georgenia faecalis TaxID=2483799 RepID=UPI0019D235FF|nr:hypothetical protein [Georgenia faecalis]
MHQRTHGTKHLHHPVVGALDVQFETMTLPGDLSQVLYLYTVEPGSASAEALALLASWTQSSPAGAHRSTGRPPPDDGKGCDHPYRSARRDECRILMSSTTFSMATAPATAMRVQSRGVPMPTAMRSAGAVAVKIIATRPKTCTRGDGSLRSGVGR